MARKILIVDDDSDLRKMLLRALGSLAEVSEASNGPEALREVEASRPRLMLLDVAMPEMDGLAVLRAARALLPNLVVVMLTGESDLAVAKTALELGARTYITKPFDMDVVFGEIQRLLESAGGGEDPPPDRPWRVAV